MSRRPLDPRKVNVLIDNNALDPSGGYQAEVDRLLGLKAAGKVVLIAPGGVREEALHPNTPPVVRESVADQVFSLPVGLNQAEQQLLATIRSILQGNAAPGLHDADARHVFEAAKYGGGYFITHDRRINKTKRQELEKILPPSLWIVTAAEFLTIYDHYEQEYPA
ncbi:MAG TPA: hypothetical protein VJ376_12630 [Pseudomonadota bacterium]|nr:hypothetical protein [Pseudomonadota bacterium]